MSDDTTLTRDTYTDAATTPTRSNVDDTHLDYDPDSGFSKNRYHTPQARSHAEYQYDEFTEWVTGKKKTRKNYDVDELDDTIF